jgi:hypothetical protein
MISEMRNHPVAKEVDDDLLIQSSRLKTEDTHAERKEHIPEYKELFEYLSVYTPNNRT